MKSLFIALLFSFSSFAADTYYCNGQMTKYGGDSLFPNGQRVQLGSTSYYPNGVAVSFAGDLYYPNGNKMSFAGDELHITGERVVFAGDLLYPNGQRVEFGGDCYHSTGVRMGSCPKTINFVTRSGKFKVYGTLDLKEKKILSQSYEYIDGRVTTYFSITQNGKVEINEVICE